MKRKFVLRSEMLKTAIYTFILSSSFVNGFPDPGQWSASYVKVSSAIFGIEKPLYAGSSIHILVNCEPHSSHQKIELQWVIRQTSCFEDYLASDIYSPEVLYQYFTCPIRTNYSPKIRYFISKPVFLECSNRIHLELVNSTFITYSDKLDNPPGCPKYRPTIYSPDSTPAQEKVQNESNDVHEIPQNQENQINDTHMRSRRNVTENAKMNKDKASETKHNLKDSSVITQDAAVNPSVQESHQPLSGSDLHSSEHPRETVKANFAAFQSNETFSEQSSYNQFSGPFYSTTNVKLGSGSKLTTVDMDGIYLFILTVRSTDQKNFNISVDVAMKGDHGYLSAIDYPLLLFYGLMCGLYVIYAVAWLIMSALQWRDLLRIQFWIGAVILLGLMEKAVFYAEYQSINYTGQSVQGAILFAEILSCMKRTLARMLIIIVSLGFGIVKPRLGPMLHRIVGIGALYFCLGTIEGCLRVLKPKTDPGNQALMAGIPLAVTDSAICWWIFSSLVQTIRTLRVRRNIVKLQLYRHFTNTLLLSVVGSVAFMTWSIHAHKLVNCIMDWKELWVDEAYWHFLFSTILFVIMILWRPTNNNQRYAFTPLLDAMDNDDDEEDDSPMTNDAFAGMKMRATKNNSGASPKQDDSKSKQDEDLKWVEENIPTSLTDVALPSVLDSDEEIMTAKLERSKME